MSSPAMTVNAPLQTWKRGKNTGVLEGWGPKQTENQTSASYADQFNYRRRTCIGGPLFHLRFPIADFDHWSERYQYEGDAVIEQSIVPVAKQAGFLTREQFLTLCHWKSPRTAPRCARNSPDFIKEITRVALSAADERLKIGVLTLLEGVSWPTASVILHFCDRMPYPILDFRALWSLSVRPPSQYTFSLWHEYTMFVRGLATESGRTMRTVDRALWQYSKERQR